jgi:hypothetical protein
MSKQTIKNERTSDKVHALVGQVASISLPVGVKELAGMVDDLEKKHGKGLVMRQIGNALIISQAQTPPMRLFGNRKGIMKIEIAKETLFNFVRSHSKLNQAEYARNPSYNNEHFAYIAEQEMIAELENAGLLAELLEAGL